MEALAEHKRMVPRFEYVGQNEMDALRAHLKNEIILTHTALPGALSVATREVLVDVDDFRSITTKFDIYPYKSITPFLGKNRAILSITATGSGDVLYNNAFLRSGDSETNFDYISKTLGFDIDVLRRLSFGCGVADRLRAQDIKNGVDIRK